MSLSEPQPLFPMAAPQPPKLRRRRLWPVGLGVFIALVAGGYAAAYATYGDAVPSGTTVEGVAIGGMSAEQAEQLLTEQLPGLVDQPIEVTVADKTVTVTPSDLGLSVDVNATVKQAGGGSPNPISLWQAATGDAGEIPVVTSIDDAALSGGLTALNKELTTDAVDGSIKFSKAKVVVKDAVVGQSIDVAAASADLAQSYPFQSSSLTLPRTEIVPDITQAEIDEAVTDLAKPAVSGPVIVKTALGSTTISASQLGQSLTIAPGDSGALQLTLDGKKLAKLADSNLDDVSQKVRNARVEIRGGSPVIIPARTGKGITATELQKAVLPALTSDKRSATVTLTTTQPKIGSTDKAVTSVKTVVSSFTTYFPYAEYRNVNIGRAASLIDNTFLEPGEVFSLNGIVGERTRANGFTSGFIIADGQFREELGGGVSQVATTSFNAGHFAGFTDVQHKAHSLYISRYPRGREATVAWPSLDMQFKNNTPYGAVVDTSFSRAAPGGQGALTVRIWSTKYWAVTSSTGNSYNFTTPTTVYDTTDKCTATEPVSGFDVNVRRKLSRDGKVVSTENIFTRYQPTNRVVCGPRP